MKLILGLTWQLGKKMFKIFYNSLFWISYNWTMNFLIASQWYSLNALLTWKNKLWSKEWNFCNRLCKKITFLIKIWSKNFVKYWQKTIIFWSLKKFQIMTGKKKKPWRIIRSFPRFLTTKSILKISNNFLFQLNNKNPLFLTLIVLMKFWIIFHSVWETSYN